MSESASRDGSASSAIVTSRLAAFVRSISRTNVRLGIRFCVIFVYVTPGAIRRVFFTNEGPETGSRGSPDRAPARAPAHRS